MRGKYFSCNILLPACACTIVAPSWWVSVSYILERVELVLWTWVVLGMHLTCWRVGLCEGMVKGPIFARFATATYWVHVRCYYLSLHVASKIWTFQCCGCCCVLLRVVYQLCCVRGALSLISRVSSVGVSFFSTCCCRSFEIGKVVQSMFFPSTMSFKLTTHHEIGTGRSCGACYETSSSASHKNNFSN